MVIVCVLGNTILPKCIKCSNNYHYFKLRIKHPKFYTVMIHFSHLYISFDRKGRVHPKRTSRLPNYRQYPSQKMMSTLSKVDVTQVVLQFWQFCRDVRNWRWLIVWNVSWQNFLFFIALTMPNYHFANTVENEGRHFQCRQKNVILSKSYPA